MSRTAFLRLERLLSLALIALSITWAGLRGLPLVEPLTPSLGLVAVGMVAGAAFWGTIPILLRSPAMRRVWMEVLLPLSRALTTRDILIIALLSGFTEELFFRGILLAEIGLVPSSLFFGALHALCAAYFAWATVVGAGLGALTLLSNTLVIPIAAHAMYNFGALWWLRRTALLAAPPALVMLVPTRHAASSKIASPHGIG